MSDLLHLSQIIDFILYIPSLKAVIVSLNPLLVSLSALLTNLRTKYRFVVDIEATSGFWQRNLWRAGNDKTTVNFLLGLNLPQLENPLIIRFGFWYQARCSFMIFHFIYFKFFTDD